MPAPAVSDTAGRLYDRLRPYQRGDEAAGWLLLYLCEALALTLAKPTDVLRHDDTGSGWRRALDPDRTAEWMLPFLAQLVGGPQLVGLTPTEQRAVIRDAPGLRRGTRASLERAIKETLTGTKWVDIVERNESAYRLLVVTRTTETPDAAATLAAILTQKPAGIVLDYEVSDVPLIDEGDLSIDSVSAAIDTATTDDVT